MSVETHPFAFDTRILKAVFTHAQSSVHHSPQLDSAQSFTCVRLFHQSRYHTQITVHMTYLLHNIFPKRIDCDIVRQPIANTNAIAVDLNQVIYLIALVCGVLQGGS